MLKTPFNIPENLAQQKAAREGGSKNLFLNS